MPPDLRARLGEAIFRVTAGPDGPRHRERIHGRPGPRWFDPASPIGRVHGDASMFVGGIRALLLQTLHPAAMTGGRRALRLPQRHARAARAHQPVPRGHHLRPRRRRRSRRSTRSAPIHERVTGTHARRDAVRRHRPAPARAGSTSPRSTASCAPTRSTASGRWTRPGGTSTSRRPPRSPAGSGSLDPPTTEAELADGARGATAPSSRATDHAREAVRHVVLKPPLAARRPPGVRRAGRGRDRAAAALEPPPAAAAVAAGVRAHRRPAARHRGDRHDPVGA